MPNLLDVIREEFFSRLQAQTNWGKNQVQALYTEVERNVLAVRLNDQQILNPALLVNDDSPKKIPINNKDEVIRLAKGGSIRHKYWLDSDIWCPSLLDVPDKYKSEENAAFDERMREARKPAPKGLYNPGDFIAPEPDKDFGDENPFKDDKDVNKGSL